MYNNEMLRAASVVIVLLLSTAEFQAQVIGPARWEKVDGLPSGTQILVALKTGERIQGTFLASSPQDLALTATTGSQRRVSKPEVQDVTVVKKDKVLDGLLLGTAIGAGVGVAVGYDRRTFECRAGCSIGIGVTLFTPIGALVGWLRDRKENQTEVLYKAP
jgi:hypothetical protein